MTHLLTAADDPGRIAGAIGFGVRENTLYVFKAKAVIITTGGASNVFRPRSTAKAWAAPGTQSSPRAQPMG